jgi:hypothetical protein
MVIISQCRDVCIKAVVTCMRLTPVVCCLHPVFKDVFLDRKVQLSQSASAQQTIRQISLLGPELDSPSSSSVPSAPPTDLTGLVAELRLNGAALARVVAAVGNASNVVPDDADWWELWNMRTVRGDFTLGSDITTGSGAVVAVLDTGEAGAFNCRACTPPHTSTVKSIGSPNPAFHPNLTRFQRLCTL